MRKTPPMWSLAAVLAIFISGAAGYARNPGSCGGDLNGDGCVDLSDLATLLAVYGESWGQAWAPDEHTVGLWYLNGNGDDFSENGNDLTIKTDRVAWGTDGDGCRGWVMMGADPGDSSGCPDNGALVAPGATCTYPGSGDWTVEAWVYFPSNNTGYNVVQHYSEDWAGHDPYQLNIQNGTAVFEINNSVSVSADVSSHAGEWFHLAAVYRCQQDIAIWVDDVCMATELTTEIPEVLTDYDVYLGGNYCGTSPNIKLDEVRISSVARYPGWVPVTTFEPRYLPGVASLNEEIYVVGGGVGDVYVTTVIAYDTAADEWRQVADMSHSRNGFAATACGGRIYAMGGQPVPHVPERTPVVEEYDSISDSWTTIAPLQVARYRLTAATAGGKVYAIGGDIVSATTPAVEEYDPNDPGGGWRYVAPLPSSLYNDDDGAGVLDDEIYYFGGAYPETDTIYRYDPSDPNNVWSQLSTPMPQQQYTHGVAELDDAFYIAGGALQNTVPLDTFWRYTPATSEWEALPPLPFADYQVHLENVGDTLYFVSPNHGVILKYVGFGCGQ